MASGSAAMLRRAAELRPSRLYVFMSGQRDGKVPGFVLGGKVQGSPRAGAQSRGKLSASAETAVALLSSWITNEAE